MKSTPPHVKNPRITLLLTALLYLFVSGCATRDLVKLSQPAFQMPARFDTSGDAPLRNRWWQAFDDPGLDQLVDYALTHNFNLQSAYARVQQAKATIIRQRSGLFPTLSGSVSDSATRRPNTSNGNFDFPTSLGGVGGAGGSGSTGSSGSASGGGSGTTGGGTGFSLNSDRSNWTNTGSVRLTASYELDLFGRIRNGLKASRLDERALQSALQSAAITLAGNIASNWYQYQELRARVTLLQAQIKTNKDVLQLTTFSFTNGQGAAADVLRQRNTVDSVRGQLAQAKAQEAVSRHALAVLVGKAPEAFDPPAGKLVALPPLPKTGVPLTLLMRRPDVRQNYFTLAADNRRVAVAMADRYPQLSLSASYSATSDTGTLFTDRILNLGAQLTQPLFDAGSRAAEVTRTQAVVDENVADFQQSLLGGLQEVEDALSNERQQEQFLQHLDDQLTRANKISANLRLRYLRGATAYLDVLDALLSRQQLQLNKLAGERQLLDYRINLYRALAGGLDDPAIGNGATQTTTADDTMPATRTPAS